MDSQVFQYGSAIVGGLAVLSVCFVFVKTKTFDKAGFGLLVSGTILIGLPVWSSAKFAWNSDGVEFEFKTIAQKLAALDEKVSSSTTLSSEVRQEISSLASAVEKVQRTNNLAMAAFIGGPRDAADILMRTEESKEKLNEKVREITNEQ